MKEVRVRHGRSWFLAWSTVPAAILLVTLTLIARFLFVVETGDANTLLSNEILTPFIATAYTVVGATVTSRHPRNPVGWIFMLVGVLSVLQTLANATIVYSPVLFNIDRPPGLDLAEWLATWVWIPGVVLSIMFVYLLFPDGHLLSKRWLVVLLSATLGLMIMVLGLAFHPGPSDAWKIGENPFGISSLGTVLDILLQAAWPLLAVGLIGSIAALIVRARRSRDIERQQMKWLVYATGLTVASILLATVARAIWPNNLLAGEFGVGLVSLAILGIAVAASIAILRYRLYDINLVINRTLVYVALTVIIVAVYILIVFGFGILFQSQGNLLIALFATGLVAIIFQPLRERVQRSVNRMFYGERDDPLSSLSQLGKRLEGTLAPEVILPTLVETIAQTLRLPYAAISLRTGEEFRIVAQSGEQVESAIYLPLNYQGGMVGQLIAGRRSARESFSKRDRRLLENIAYQAGPAVHTVQLNAELRRSRQHLVTAREEERRRLRRDLHDGLGPLLASQGLKMAAASQLLWDDPARSERLLDDLATQNEATVAEIRRLVHALRPAALDDLGLVGAIEDYVDGLSTGPKNARHLQVRVKAPDDGLPLLPAAIEVASYRIATEALTNIARHAHARNATVSFDIVSTNGTETLHLAVLDDGIGLSSESTSGVGLISMKERTEEVGGRISIDSPGKKGTRVIAELPLVEIE